MGVCPPEKDEGAVHSCPIKIVSIQIINAWKMAIVTYFVVIQIGVIRNRTAIYEALTI